MGSVAGRPLLSIVVMGYLNEATIARSVRSVLEQEADDPVEVIVVVSGSDRSPELLRERFPGLPLFESPARLTPGACRNVGVRRSTGDLVAFLAGDCVAAPGWVRRRISAHRAGHQVVAGAVSIDEPRTGSALAGLHLWYSARLIGHRAGPAADDQAYSLSFDRSVLDAAGLFREDVNWGEDTLMVDRLRDLGIPAWFEPSIFVAHLGPTTLRELLSDQFRRGRKMSSWEIFTTGRFPRRWWHSLPIIGSPTGAASLRAIKRLRARWHWIFPNVWRATAGRRRELVVALPAMVMGSVAYHAGWAAGQVRAPPVDARQGSETP